MELASPSPDEPVTQIEADVPIEPLALHADAMDLELDLHSYERPLAVSPFGTPEMVRCPPTRPLAVGSCLHVGPSSRSRRAGICVGAPCNRTSISCNLCALACTCSRQHHLAWPRTTSCSCNRISRCGKPCRHIGS